MLYDIHYFLCNVEDSDIDTGGLKTDLADFLMEYEKKTGLFSGNFEHENLMASPSESEISTPNDPSLITPEDLPIQVENPSFPPGKTPQKLGFLGVGGADPVTAGFNAAAAMFNFFCTVQGQRFVGDMLTIDEFLVKKIYQLFVKIHDFVEKKG